MSTNIHNLTLKEYLSKDYSPEYVDKIISYYKNAFQDYIINADNKLTGYRENLLGLINETTFIDKSGDLVNNRHNIREDDGNSCFGVNTETDGCGLVIFSILQYEHDTVIDQYQKKYNTRKVDYDSLKNDSQECQKHTAYKKHELFRLKSQTDSEKRSVVLFEELFFKYGYGTSKYYSGLCSWNGKKLLIQLRTDLQNPMLPLLEKMLSDGNINIHIIFNSNSRSSRIVTNLSGTQHLCVDNSWMIDVEE